MSKFSKLSSKIEKKEGISKGRSDAIAAKIGREKYGKKGMAKKAAEGRRKAARNGHR